MLRSVVAVACCFCGMSVFAQNGTPTVVATGGVTNDVICCTIGQTFVGDNCGMWDGSNFESTDVPTDIHAVYDDGDVVVENSNEGSSLSIRLSDELLAQGASYTIYNIAGMVLDHNAINENPYVLKYDNLLNGQYIIVAIKAGNNVVATYKLFK